MPATVAVATNALRQLPKRANIPPTSGPSKTDMLQLVDINAIVRDQNASGKVVRTATSAAAASNPPPNPWTRRPATIQPMVVASEQSNAPRPNVVTPTQ